MENNEIRLYYKNQIELCNAIRDYIDDYFENKFSDTEFEETLINVINTNREKIFINDTYELANKPKQIIGKKRKDIIIKILAKKGVIKL